MTAALPVNLYWFLSELKQPLVLFGFAGQLVFFLRFVVQWFASERRGQVHVPVAFWYLSLAGGLILLVYAVLRRDLVFSTAQALGLLIYSRNLVLVYRPRPKLAPGPACRTGTAPVAAEHSEHQTVPAD